MLLGEIRKGANGGKVSSDRVREYLREAQTVYGAQEDHFSILTERRLGNALHELARGLSGTNRLRRY